MATRLGYVVITVCFIVYHSSDAQSTTNQPFTSTASFLVNDLAASFINQNPSFSQENLTRPPGQGFTTPSPIVTNNNDVTTQSTKFIADTFVTSEANAPADTQGQLNLQPDSSIVSASNTNTTPEQTNFLLNSVASQNTSTSNQNVGLTETGNTSQINDVAASNSSGITSDTIGGPIFVDPFAMMGSSLVTTTARPDTATGVINSVTTVMDIINQTTSAGTTLPPCDLGPATQCASSAYQELFTYSYFILNTQRPWTEIYLRLACQRYDVHRTCLQSALNSCSPKDRIQYDMPMAAMDYICSINGTQAILNTLPCMRNRRKGLGVQVCELVARRDYPQYGICYVMSNYINCMGDVFKSFCGVDSAQGIGQLLQVTFQPLHQVEMCTAVPVPPPTAAPTITTTTTTASSINTTTSLPTTASSINTTTLLPTIPASSPAQSAIGMVNASTIPSVIDHGYRLQCYVCNNRFSGWRLNSLCTADGELSRSNISPQICTAPCFANLRPAGYVVRGCASGFESLFPGGFPRQGCRRVNGDVWCFCTRNGCNRMDMEEYI